MAKKVWRISEHNKDLAAGIAESYELNPLTALLAVSRGISSNNEIEAFFGNEPELSDPFLIPGMDKAVERISRAIEEFEQIAIFGDYDADGVTATAILYSYLESNGANVIRVLPDRHTEGYGISEEAVNRLNELGISLIITVDNGISALAAAKRAGELKIDLIITDHHLAGETLPEAVAIINPHLSNEEGGFKELSGAGVALKLVCALEGGESDTALENFADLAALGTVADVVPLKEENRTIVKYGLHSINERVRPSISALADAAGCADKYISSTSLAFILAPRINAAGRMGSADTALDLLLCEEEEQAELFAKDICEANTQRQSVEQKIFKEVEAELAKKPEKAFEKVIVVHGRDWHPGVIGIVAARIVEKYGRPCIIISTDGETARGSARSIEGFSVYEAISAASDCLIHHGGHTLAAGLSLKHEKLEEFCEKIKEYTKNIELPFPELKIDCRLNPKHLTLEILDAVQMLEPFGAGNPTPVFAISAMAIEEIRPLSKGKHTKITVYKNGVKLSPLLFGVETERFPFESGDVVDIAVTLDRNVYLEKVSVALHVKGIRLSEMSEQEICKSIKLYEKIRRGEELSNEEKLLALPRRDIFVGIYKYIKEKKERNLNIERLCRHFGNEGSLYCKIAIALDVMENENLIVQQENGRFFAPEMQGKTDLEGNHIMVRLKNNNI